MICISLPVFGQVIDSCGNVSGTDPLLVNGRIYSYYPPAGVDGTPYLHTEMFMRGTLLIRGVEYPDQLLNYDVLNQDVLLKYTMLTGAPQIISVSVAWLKSFSFGGMSFVYRAPSEDSPGIYQVIGEGPLQIDIHWSKSLELRNMAGVTKYVFPRSG